MHERIWVWFADNGNIRKWESTPFDEGVEYAVSGNARPTWIAAAKFRLGDRVTKIKGSRWTGHIVGFYATTLTPNGYAVESENEPGSVQIYPEAALTFAAKRRVAETATPSAGQHHG